MKQPLSITFILSGPAPNPSGGVRIIYEYANRFSRKGWKVSVIHPVRLESGDLSLPPSIKFKRRIGLLKNRFFGTFLPKKWFIIDPKVKMTLVPDLREQNIPDAYYIVVGPSQCAPFVNNYGLRKGKKVYFIQGFEDWVMPVPDLENTWKMPMKKIVVSSWLQNKLTSIHERSECIPNGLNFSAFSIDRAYSKRPPQSILFVSHFQELKGTIFAVEAVKKLKEKFPQLAVNAFSVYDKPAFFPDFIFFHKNPTQKQIRNLYNSSRFFLSPSLSEGWPLPPAEAMMCGCAVVVSDIPGHREYIDDGKNGFLCAPGSVAAFVEKLDFLFNNPAVAESVAHDARESLQKFDWDSRVRLFEAALLAE